MNNLGRALDAFRRFLAYALFLGLVVALIAAAVAAWRARPRVPERAALVLDPRGLLVEQLSGESRGWLVRTLLGGPAAPRETLVKDVLDALRLARDDARIPALDLDLDDFAGGGLSKLQDVGRALDAFRAAGKKIVTYTDGLTQRPYYLAARADEIMLHPDGIVFLQGFGGYRPYYKEGLDRFGIEMHVFRVGEFKSAVEPYLRNDMSPEAKEEDLDVYGDLWRAWLADVARARGRDATALAHDIDTWPDRVEAAGGDLARAALDARLVDTLAPRDRLRARMIELVGKADDGHDFRRVGFRTYLAARAKDRAPKGRGPGVAVIVARGDILDGTQPPGTIGGDSTAALIRRAREDDDAKALVLRIDSPGGSAFAAEVIRRECELTRKAGKPVVVSMGSVAASGGYWIATSSDEIWASPTTITGSIGIFGVFPDVHRALARYLGVHLDGVGTTPWTGAFNPGHALDPAVAATFQRVIDRGYEDFLAHVAEARHMTRDEVDRIARGRIWSGEDAKALGLVDHLGNFDDAVAAAAKRAHLPAGYRVFTVAPERPFRERLLRSLLGAARRLGMLDGADAVRTPPAPPPPVSRLLGSIEMELGRVARWNDPMGAYAHCLCGEEWP
jgi:protease-4